MILREGNKSSFKQIKFNTAVTSECKEGYVGWNEEEGTLQIGMAGGQVCQQVGQEILIRVTNKTGSTVLNGQPVYISGGAGSNVWVARADASSQDNSRKTIAVATQDILNNHKGYVTVFGYVHDLNTSAFTDGDELYLAVGGGITNVKPTLPNAIVKVGYCTRAHATVGDIFVNISANSIKEINTDIGDLNIKTAAGYTAVIDQPVWQDINLGGTALGTGASAPDLINLDTTSISVYAFDGNVTSEMLSGSFELQHDYKEGTDLYPHLHFLPVNANAGTVKFFLEYYIREDNRVKLTATISATKATNSIAWEELLLAFPAITGTSLKIGSQIFFRLYRVPTDAADTYNSDVALATVGIHYQIDTLGSRQISTK
jgi:hypothetical protein